MHNCKGNVVAKSMPLLVRTYEYEYFSPRKEIPPNEN